MMNVHSVGASFGKLRHVIVLIGLVSIVSSFYYFRASETVIVALYPTQYDTVVPIPRQHCCAVCIKDKKDRLMEVQNVGLLESIPVPLCDLAESKLDEKAYEEWNSRGHCGTMCLKDEKAHLTAINKTCDHLPLCRNVDNPHLDFQMEESEASRTEKEQFWARTENLAGGCNNVHALNRSLYHSLDNAGVHLVYFVWMKSNKNARKIVPEQLYDVERSGLFGRPNTFLHIVVSTDSDAELDWLQKLPVVKKHAKSITRTKKNRYEFPGIRMLWELGCKALSERRNNDVFLYFHSKGSRYNVGRAGLEVAMTYELVANWRLILNLIVANPSALSMGLGGPGFQWITFFWARAELFATAPMPAMTHSRYWYEFWAGFDLRTDFPSRASVSQCHLATGIESIPKLADSDFMPKDVKGIPNDRANRTFENFRPEHLTKSGRVPQYSILRCGMIEVTSPAVQKWWRPTAKRFEAYIRDRANFTKTAGV